MSYESTAAAAAGAENAGEKKGPSKKELNKLARKEKRGAASAEAPAGPAYATTYQVQVPKAAAHHPLLVRAIEVVSRGQRDFGVKYIATVNDYTAKNLSVFAQEATPTEVLLGEVAIARYFLRLLDSSSSTSSLSRGGDAFQSSQIDSYLDLYAQSSSLSTATLLSFLNRVLESRTYLVSQSLSVADLALYLALLRRGDKEVTPLLNDHVHAARWFALIAAQVPVEISQPLPVTFISQKSTSESSKSATKTSTSGVTTTTSTDKAEKDVGDKGACPPLVDAVEGEVVTRFPPEPSGYLHIGHAKAVLLNLYYAQRYKGKLIVRFDDTNPTKEKEEFEENILRDLHSLGVTYDRVTHTSDYFSVLEDYARKLISLGLAYMDDTPQEVMQSQRQNKIPSINRDRSINENLSLFESLLKGEEQTQNYCLRAKIDYLSVNGTMRDPVLYRYLGGDAVPHHRTGTLFKAYPTYDFACPIVDAIEGVSHALRTTEYNDRDEQYHWIQSALSLRHVHIMSYGKMNFVNTVLSKRKLTWFVEQGLVDGWTDPRFPTVQGCKRRGVDVEALKRFIISQGASRRIITMEWDKFWAENKKVLEEKAPRFMAVSCLPPPVLLTVHNHNPEGLGLLEGEDPSLEVYSGETPVHPQKPEMGTRQILKGRSVYIDQIDAESVSVGDTVTLLRWGNVIIEEVQATTSAEGVRVVSGLVGRYDHTATNFSKTKKWTWLTLSQGVFEVEVWDLDHLLTKAKIEEDENFADFVNYHSKKVSFAKVDPLVKTLREGDVVQFERKGFFRVDRAFDEDREQRGEKMVLVAIPDGRAK